MRVAKVVDQQHEDFEAVSSLDTTGADALRQVHGSLAALGVQLAVARALGDVADFMRRVGVGELIGDENLFATSAGAILRLAEISPHPDEALAATAREAATPFERSSGMSTFLWVLFAAVYIACLVVLGAATLRKGHWLLFGFGIIFPLLWIVGSLLGPTQRAAGAQ